MHINAVIYTMEKRKVIRPNKIQLNKLVNYMYQHRKFAVSELNVYELKRHWEILVNQLNHLGPKRTTDQWRTSWRDIKKRARFENDIVEMAKKRVADGEKIPIPVLSPQSVAVMAILKSKGKQNGGDVQSHEMLKMNMSQDETGASDSSDSNPEPSRLVSRSPVSAPRIKVRQGLEIEGGSARRDPAVMPTLMLPMLVPRPVKRNIRPKRVQVNMLIDFMSKEPDLAKGKISGQDSIKTWRALTRQLNSFGPARTIDQWKHTWTDLKRHRLKAVPWAKTSYPEPEPRKKIIKILRQGCNTVSSDSESGRPDKDADLSPNSAESAVEDTPIEWKTRKLVRPVRHQLDKMLEYMSTHLPLSNGADTSVKHWEHLTKQLNKIGPKRSVAQWRITWRDLKRRTQMEFLEPQLQDKNSEKINTKASDSYIIEAIAKKRQLDLNISDSNNDFEDDISDNYEETIDNSYETHGDVNDTCENEEEILDDGEETHDNVKEEKPEENYLDMFVDLETSPNPYSSSNFDPLSESKNNPSLRKFPTLSISPLVPSANRSKSTVKKRCLVPVPFPAIQAEIKKDPTTRKLPNASNLEEKKQTRNLENNVLNNEDGHSSLLLDILHQLEQNNAHHRSRIRRQFKKRLQQNKWSNNLKF